MAARTKKGDIGRNKAERLALLKRRDEVSALYFQGIPQYQIAERLGVDAAQVTRDLQFLERLWLEGAVENRDRWKAEEIARINHMEREAYAAWERSKQERETRTARNATRPKGAETETGLRKEQRCGDTEYLKTVQWCINKRCELRGLDAPKKAEVDLNARYADLTHEQRIDRIRTLTDQLNSRGAGLCDAGRACGTPLAPGGNGDRGP